MDFLRNHAPELLIVLVGVYFFFFFQRAARLAGFRTDTFPVRAALVLLSAAFVFPALNVWGVWAVVVLHAFVFSLLADFLNLIVRRAGRGGKRWRRIYQSGVLPAFALSLLLWYGWWNAHHVVRTNYTVQTEKRLREGGYRVAVLSDLHYGTTMGREKLEEYCAEISRERPDLVVLLGDIVDENTSAKQMQEAFRILSGIPAEEGVFYVYGNHDRGYYSSEPDFSPAELETAIKRSGIIILRDSVQTINGELTLIGREDYSRHICEERKIQEELLREANKEELAWETDKKEMLSEVDKEELPEEMNGEELPQEEDAAVNEANYFRILLDHQPRELEKNAALGIDLQLSGHTHGGQIWPVGEISDLLGFGEMNYGRRQLGAFQAIVTSGIGGGGYALRTGKHCEYVIIDIVRA